MAASVASSTSAIGSFAGLVNGLSFLPGVAKSAVIASRQAAVTGVAEPLQIRAFVGAALAERRDVVYVLRRPTTLPAVGFLSEDLNAEPAPFAVVAPGRCRRAFPGRSLAGLAEVAP